MLASVKFGKLLFPGWDYGSKALTQPEFYDIDQDAFSIMLNIIYCRTQVPHSIDLGMLTKLAVLTDYFGCHEALEPYPSILLEGLKDEVPTTFSDELIKWICITWVFNYDDVFTKVTRIAQRQAPNDLDLLNLPIPESVYSVINNGRRAALSSIFAALRRRREELESKDILCSYECDSLLPGTLLKSTRIYGPPMDAEPPYPGIAVESAVQCLTGIKHPKVHMWHQVQGYLGESSQLGRNVGECSLLGMNVQNELYIAMCRLDGLFWNKPSYSAKHFLLF